jgi:hypothetical protein
MAHYTITQTKEDTGTSMNFSDASNYIHAFNLISSITNKTTSGSKEYEPNQEDSKYTVSYNQGSFTIDVKKPGDNFLISDVKVSSDSSNQATPTIDVAQISSDNTKIVINFSYPTYVVSATKINYDIYWTGKNDNFIDRNIALRILSGSPMSSSEAISEMNNVIAAYAKKKGISADKVRVEPVTLCYNSSTTDTPSVFSKEISEAFYTEEYAPLSTIDKNIMLVIAYCVKNGLLSLKTILAKSKIGEIGVIDCLREALLSSLKTPETLDSFSPYSGNTALTDVTTYKYDGEFSRTFSYSTGTKSWGYMYSGSSLVLEPVIKFTANIENNVDQDTNYDVSFTVEDPNSIVIYGPYVSNKTTTSFLITLMISSDKLATMVENKILSTGLKITYTVTYQRYDKPSNVYTTSISGYSQKFSFASTTTVTDFICPVTFGGNWKTANLKHVDYIVEVGEISGVSLTNVRITDKTYDTFVIRGQYTSTKAVSAGIPVLVLINNFDQTDSETITQRYHITYDYKYSFPKSAYVTFVFKDAQNGTYTVSQNLSGAYDSTGRYLNYTTSGGNHPNLTFNLDTYALTGTMHILTAGSNSIDFSFNYKSASDQQYPNYYNLFNFSQINITSSFTYSIATQTFNIVPSAEASKKIPYDILTKPKSTTIYAYKYGYLYGDQDACLLYIPFAHNSQHIPSTVSLSSIHEYDSTGKGGYTIIPASVITLESNTIHSPQASLSPKYVVDDGFYFIYNVDRSYNDNEIEIAFNVSHKL